MTSLSTAWNIATQQLATASKAFAAQEALNPRSDALDDLCDAVTAAENALFQTAAPHIRAALWKMDHLQEMADGSSIAPEQIRLVSADIRRLIGEE